MSNCLAGYGFSPDRIRRKDAPEITWEKRRIDDRWGMNVGENMFAIELFRKSVAGKWQPVIGMELHPEIENTYVVSFYDNFGKCCATYPFGKKWEMQAAIKGHCQYFFEDPFLLPPAVTDILDSWALAKRMIV